MAGWLRLLGGKQDALPPKTAATLLEPEQGVKDEILEIARFKKPPARDIFPISWRPVRWLFKDGAIGNPPKRREALFDRRLLRPSFGAPARPPRPNILAHDFGFGNT